MFGALYSLMFKNKKAFSLIDALIILVGIAVIIVLSTPVITKKSVNIADIGASLSGSTRGRVEVFYKEIIKIDGTNSGWYEKISDPTGDVKTITIYERKEDRDHIALVPGTTSSTLEIKNNKKPILYEEYSEAIPVATDASGVISSFKFTNTPDVIAIGGKYIAELKGTKYYKTDSNGKTQTPLVELPRGQYRIIEGNVASYAGKHGSNNLWLVDLVTTETDGEYTISEDTSTNIITVKKGTSAKLKSIPWYRSYSGDKLDKDEKLNSNETKITFPQDIKKVQFYGVGGGGRGAVVSIDEARKGTLFLNDTSHPEYTDNIAKIRFDLAKRFEELYFEKKNSVTDTAHKDQIKSLVCGGKAENSSVGGCFDPNRIVCLNNGTKTDFEQPIKIDGTDIFTEKGCWISINKGDGSISAKFDARTGLVFPHELLKYTKVVGSQTQSAQLYDMPEWFNWKTLNEKYCIAASACGTEGKDAPTFTWYTKLTSWDQTDAQGNLKCFRDAFANNSLPTEASCTELEYNKIYTSLYGNNNVDCELNPFLPGCDVANNRFWYCTESPSERFQTNHLDILGDLYIRAVECYENKGYTLKQNKCEYKCNKVQTWNVDTQKCECIRNYPCGSHAYRSNEDCNCYCNSGYEKNSSGACVISCAKGQERINGSCYDPCPGTKKRCTGKTECQNSGYCQTARGYGWSWDACSCINMSKPFAPSASKLDLNRNYESEIKETLGFKIRKFFSLKKGHPTGYADGFSNPSTLFEGATERLKYLEYMAKYFPHVQLEKDDAPSGVEEINENNYTSLSRRIVECERNDPDNNAVRNVPKEGYVVYGEDKNGLGSGNPNCTHNNLTECLEPIKDENGVEIGKQVKQRYNTYHCGACKASWIKNCVKRICDYPKQCSFYECPAYKKPVEQDCFGNYDCLHTCPDMSMGIKENIPHHYRGGKGGVAPKCAIAKVNYNAATANYTKPVNIVYTEKQEHICENKCDGDDYKLFETSSAKFKASDNFTVHCDKFGGDSGLTRKVTIGGYTAESTGSEGGRPYPFNVITHTKGENLTKEQAECVRDKVNKFNEGKPANSIYTNFENIGLVPNSCDKNGENCDYRPVTSGVVNDINSFYDACGLNKDASEYTGACESGTYRFDVEMQCRAKTIAEGGGDGATFPQKDNDGSCSYKNLGIPGNEYVVQGREFNHIYVWSAPFASNALVHGDAGTPGQTDKTEVDRITGEIIIKLGRGALSATQKATNTTVKMSGFGGGKILNAKAGTNGTVTQKAIKYDMCHNEPSATRTCSSLHAGGLIIPCCDNESGAHSTKEILSTSPKMSPFDTLKGLVGNSPIIGIGMGRSGAGYGVIAGLEALQENRRVYNISYGSGNSYTKQLTIGTSANDVVNKDKYQNLLVVPRPQELKAGDGAVVITW